MITEPITVLIANSKDQFLANLTAFLRREAGITVVSEAGNDVEIIEKTLKLKPQVLLMDAALCDISTVMSKIRESAPSITAIILGDTPREGEVFRNLYYGVKGYLLKSSPHTEIAQAIRKVSTGEVILSPSIATSMVQELRDGKTRPKLSQREEEVLELLSHGLTNHEIAEKLFVSEGTIKTYVSRLREKLNLKNRRELSIYAAKWPLASKITKRLQELEMPGNLDKDEALPAKAPASQKAAHAAEEKTTAVSEPAEVSGDECKAVTALCLGLDLRNDAKEQLNTDKIHESIGEIIDQMVQQIQRYDGLVSWFNDNGFIALFGVPTAQEHTPQKAISAAISILGNINQYSNPLRNCDVNIDIRIGINTGTVLIKARNGHNLDRRRMYIPVGDTTSCAIKAQGLAPANSIVVTENTYHVTENQFIFLPAGELTTNSSEEALKTYSVLGYNQDNNNKMRISPTRRLSRFVGREREQETLKQAFDKAKQGTVQLVGVVGEAGVGKSRLMLEFKNILTEDEFTYVEGSCLHYGDAIPYLPLLQALRCYFDIVPGEAAAITRTKIEEKVRYLDKSESKLLPPLQDIFTLEVTDEEYLHLEPLKKKNRIFEAVKDLILMESRIKPLLIIIEDCHWTDKPSEALLTYLLDSLRSAYVMFVLVYRPEWNHPFSNRSNYTQIRLNELPPNMSAELITFILDDGEADNVLQQFTIDKAGGNPLYLEELLHNLQESGYIRKDKEYLLAANPSEIKVPSSLQNIIAARIDRLEPNTKHILQIAAVIGRDFNYRILENLIGNKQELKPCLLNLQRNEFIYEIGATAETHYMFKHALTQDVAYQGLRSKGRAKLHEEIGQAIENLYPQRLEEFYEILAYHYSQSANYEKAYQYLKLSGKKLNQQASMTESLQHFRQAIDVLSRLPQTEENKRKGIEIRLDMASSMQALACPGDSIKILQEGEMLCEELHDDRSLAQIYSLMSFSHAVRGNGAERVLYAQKAFDMANRVGDVDLMAPIGFDLSTVYNIGGDFSKTVAVASKVIFLLEKTHRESELFGRGHNPYTSILANYGRATATLGNFNEGESLCDRALYFAEGPKVSDPFDIGWSHLMLGWLYVIKGDGQSLVCHAPKAAEYLGTAQMSFMVGLSYTMLGLGYYFLGDLTTSKKNAEIAMEIHKGTGISFYVSFTHLLMGMINLQLDDPANTRACFEQGLKLAQENGEKWIKALAMLWLGRCMVHADASQQEAAEKSILQGIQIFNELQSRPYAATGHLLLGEFLIETCRKQKALQHLKKAEASFAEMGMDYWIQRSRQVLSVVQE